MTLAELQAATRTLIRNRSDVVSDSDLADAVNAAYRRLVRGSFPFGRVVRSLRFHELESTWDITLQESVQSYSYPAAVLAVEAAHLQLSTGAWYPLLSRSWNEFLRVDPGTEGTPHWYTRRARKVWFAPTPDSTAAGSTVRVSTYEAPTALVASTDEPVIPDAYHLPIAYLAAYDLLSRFHDEHADRVYASAVTLLRDLQDDDALETIPTRNRPIPFTR